MKKIAIALVGSLIISMMLCVLFPSVFLKEDALWTFQSNVGRVDVAFAGEVQDGCLEIHGDNVRAYEPKWLSDNRHNQGDMILFSVSYLKRAYEITLKPQGNAKELSLIMNFRGDNMMVDGKRKPAYVHFENIRLNGRIIAEEKTVWHDEPFRYDVKNISNDSMVTLNFDVWKPISFTDIRWECVIGLLFMACSLLISCSGALGRLFNGFNRKDIVQVIAENYRNIDEVYRRAFWIIFGVLCFAFGFHTVQFMWGNHDWDFVRIEQSYKFARQEGRYMLFPLKSVFLKGIYLPFIYDALSFLSLALSAVLLCSYWRLNKRVCYYVLCGLVLTAQPFTLSIMYYAHMIPEAFIGMACAITALILFAKLPSSRYSLIYKIGIGFGGVILINISLGMYPILINTLAVAFVGRILIDSFSWDGSLKQCRFYSRFLGISVIGIFGGVVSYKLMVTFVFPIVHAYNTNTLPLSLLLSRLFLLLKQSFIQLYQCKHPFISEGSIWIILLMTCFLIRHILSTGGFRQKIVRLLLLFAALFVTQTAMFVSETYLNEARIDFYGFVVYETLVVLCCFSQLKRLHNVSIIAVSFISFVSVVNDLYALRVWKLGFDTEKMMWNRIINRLEIVNKLDFHKKYIVVLVGSRNCEAARPLFSTDKRRSADLKEYSYNLKPFMSVEFYSTTKFVSSRLMASPPSLTQAAAEVQLRRLWKAGILQKARAWPHENGLIVWDNVILYVIDEKALNAYKKQFAQEFHKQPQKTP